MTADRLKRRSYRNLAIFVGVLAVLFAMADRKPPSKLPGLAGVVADHPGKFIAACRVELRSSLHDPAAAEFDGDGTASLSGDGVAVTQPMRARNAFNALRAAVGTCQVSPSGRVISAVVQ